MSGCAQRDASVRTGVAAGVADEIAQHLGQRLGVAAQRPAGQLAQLGSARRSVGGEALEEPRQRDRLRPQAGVLFEPGEQQHVVDQPLDPRRLGQRQPLDPAHLGGVRLLLPSKHFQLAADRRQRRAQLVRRVGDEASLAQKGLVEPAEALLEGGGDEVAGEQRPGERDPAGDEHRALDLGLRVALHRPLLVAQLDPHGDQRGEEGGGDDRADRQRQAGAQPEPRPDLPHRVSARR